MKSRLIARSCFMSVIAVLGLAGCEKVEVEKGVPECVEEKINEFSKSKASCDTGAKVNEYIFQNNTVYVFDPGVCRTDQSSEVIDAECNILGAIGGWSGTLINGEDFSKADYVRTVWEN